MKEMHGMRAVRSFVVAVLAVVVVAAPAVVLSDGRVALVVGNGNFQSTHTGATRAVLRPGGRGSIVANANALA